MKQKLRRQEPDRRRGPAARYPGRAPVGPAVAAVVLAAALLLSGWPSRAAAGRARGPVVAAPFKGGVAEPVPPAERGAPEAPLAGGRVTPPEGGSRGFSHQVHRGVVCTSCHVSGGSHGALKVRTRDDCMACHHSRAQSAGCASCHAAGKLPGPAGRTVLVRTSVSPEASTRTLPFAHSFHAAVSCRDCHGAGVQRRAVKDCSGCHARHHSAARDCQRCHRPEDVKGHPMSAHGGCAGAGCHSDPAVASLSWSRTVCESCHQNRANHARGRECAACHQVPALHDNLKEVAP